MNLMMLLKDLYAQIFDMKWNVLLCIKMIVFMDFLAVAIVIPLMQSYFKEANIDTKLYAYISSTYMISQLIGTLLSGYWVDKLNKRTILLLSFLSSCISYLMIIIGFQYQNGYIMLISRVIVGLFKQTYTVSTTIIAHEHKDNEKMMTKELGHLSAIMTTAFIVGPLLGSFIFRRNKTLPCLLAAVIFMFNMIFAIVFIPKDICKLEVKEETVDVRPTLMSKMRNNVDMLVTISKLPNVSSLLTIRLLLSLFESSCSSRNIIGYFEKRYNIEAYMLGYISSLSSILSVLCDGFILPSILLHSSFISTSKFISILIVSSAIFNGIEYFNNNIYFYIFITIIPQTLIQSVLSTKLKALQLQSISSDHYGKFLSILSLLGTFLGVIAPLYSAVLFNTDGYIYRPIISAMHLLLLSIICTLLPIKDLKIKDS